MTELLSLAELERRSGVPRENETPTEYVRTVLEDTDVDDETAEAVVEAYQYGMFAEDPTFDAEHAQALDRFADDLPASGEEAGPTAVEGEDGDEGGSADSSTTEEVAPDASEPAEAGPAAAESAEAVESEETTSETADAAQRDAGGDERATRAGTSASATPESTSSSLAGWRPSVSTPDLDVSTARLGTWLVALSVLALVASVVVGAAFAPSVGETGGAAGGAGGDAPENATLVGLHVGGKIVKYGPQGNKLAATEKLSHGGSYFGVSQLRNGSVLAGFIKGGYEQCGPYEPSCFNTGFRIVDFANDSTNVQYEWTYPVRTAHSSEVHDVEMLPSGNFLVAGMEYERIFVVNRSTGNVTWQWNASQYYDPPKDPTKKDWLHINDVDRIGEGRYMVSVRNAYQILVIERGKGVVEVINKEQDPDLFKAQHNPQYLGAGAILIADSENDRVIEIHKVDGEWTVVWEIKSAAGLEFDWPRDADRLPNGNTLITDTYNERVVEVNRSGEVVWSVETGRVPYEADRLPTGEYPAGDPYQFEGGRQSIGQSSGDLPVFGFLLASLRHVAPVPYWVSDWHVVVLTFSLLGMLVGGVLRWRGK